MKNILIFIDILGVYKASDNRILNIISLADYTKYRFTIFANIITKDMLEKLKEQNVEYFIFCEQEEKSIFKRAKIANEKIEAAITKKNYTCADLYLNSSLFFPIAKLCKKASLNTIIHKIENRDLNPLLHILDKFLTLFKMPKADRYIATSKTEGRKLFLPHIIKSNKFTVIPDAIVANDYCFSEKNRVEYRHILNAKLDTLLILCVTKNYHSALKIVELFKSIKANRPDSLLYIYCKDNKKIKVDDENTIIQKLKSFNRIYDPFDCLVLLDDDYHLNPYLIEAQTNGLKCIVNQDFSFHLTYSPLTVTCNIKDTDKLLDHILSSRICSHIDLVHLTREQGFDACAQALKIISYY